MLKAGADASPSMPLLCPANLGEVVGRKAARGEDLAQAPEIGARNGDAAKTKVLVLDDERIIADTLSMILNISGYEACAVYSGEAAVEALERFQPDVLISDVVMTGMSGIDTAIIFRTLRPHCKTLLFSGLAATEDFLHNAREQGYCFEVMLKPVHPTDLLAKLRSISVALNTSVDVSNRDGWQPQ